MSTIVATATTAALPVTNSVLADSNPTTGIQYAGFSAEAIVSGLSLAYLQIESEGADNNMLDTLNEYAYWLAVLTQALILITFLEYLNGFGPPITGGDFFKNSNIRSPDITAILTNAHPNPNEWDSNAAQTYTLENQQQQNRLSDVAEGDRLLAKALAQQAHHVEQGRQWLAGARLTLYGLILVIAAAMSCAAPESALETCPFLIDTFALPLIISVSLDALAAICTLIDHGRKNVKHFHHAVSKYASAADTMAPSTAIATTVPSQPAALISTASGSSDLASGLLGTANRSGAAGRGSGSQCNHPVAWQPAKFSTRPANSMLPTNRKVKQAPQPTARPRQTAPAAAKDDARLPRPSRFTLPQAATANLDKHLVEIPG